MIPCLPPGGGEEDLDRDPDDQEEDCGSGEESLDDTGIPQPYNSPLPGCSSAFQLHSDQIQPPNSVLQFGQQFLLNPTPVLTQNLKEESQPVPWEPGYERMKTGYSGSAHSVSFRTIWHPSFCTLFDVQGHDDQLIAPPEAEGNRESSQSDKGCPALCSEDFFFSDPLLPSITRIPLGLSQTPQQILRRSRHLLAPPPIMSVWIQPSPAPILTWQCGSEITAVTSLLEMSRGETGSTPATEPSVAPPTS